MSHELCRFMWSGSPEAALCCLFKNYAASGDSPANLFANLRLVERELLETSGNKVLIPPAKK
jgi:hypothetical protein